MRVVAVVPARLASSRFPNKPLVPIAGLPMVEHVRRRVALVAGISEVVVATPDDGIRRAVEQAGGRVVMTADTHERAADRVEEAARTLDADVVVMVQGDEPLLRPNAVAAVIGPFASDAGVGCTNLLSPLRADGDRGHPDIVKAACALDGGILYFTRAAIPLFRLAGDAPVYRQTGIMAFTADRLRRFATLAPTPLERIESVDMLRFLEHGLPIRGVVVDHETIGVDRPADVAIAERALRDDPEQRAIHERIRGV